MKEIKMESGMPWKDLCEETGESYSTAMRWKRRQAESCPLIERTGPKKIASFELDSLYENICSLVHGLKRTRGTGRLYRMYSDSISRRDFQFMVDMVRYEIHHDLRKNTRRIEWLHPGMVWSMDMAYTRRDEFGRKLYFVLVQDLATRYKFDPIACFGEVPGEKIAGHLATLFKRYGPPLVLKRDNGGNLNHSTVNEVLDAYKVVPLNSPPYYPPYNGAMERGVRDIKPPLLERLADLDAPGEHFEAYAAAVVHDENHKPRESLRGRVPCQVFFAEKGGVRFNKRQRREIFDWIEQKTADIISRMPIPEEKKEDDEVIKAAWRIATETWLRKNGHIKVSINNKVLPDYPPDFVS